MSTYDELTNHLIAGNESEVCELVGAFLKEGDSPAAIISDGLIHGMSIVGKKMKSGDMFIPEVLASAGAMSKAMELLKPLLVGEELARIYQGKVVMGTVEGDLHNIGKKLVSMILESGGFEVLDIGVDVPVDILVETVRREKPDVLGLSALLTTTMPRMKEVIESLVNGHVREGVRVMIGGAPVTQEFADAIGADGYAPNAILALDLAKRLAGRNQS